MEIKAELLKPYTEDQRVNFIIENNHRKGYKIETQENKIVALGYTEEEIAQQERERLDNLELTGSDVQRAIYEAKGMDFNDLMEYVKRSEITGFDVKRLGIELKANNFVRKHPYINVIGTMLGYTSDDMDYLFENKTLPVKGDEIEDNTNNTDNI